MIKGLLFIIVLIGVCFSYWRTYPEGKLIQITIEHELIHEVDTVSATHWHKSGDKFYVITTDSIELWVDDVKQIKKGGTR